MVERHLEALQEARYPEIARALKVEQERVIEAVTDRALEPKPGGASRRSRRGTSCRMSW